MRVALIFVCFISIIAVANESDTTSSKISMSYELNAGPSFGDKGYTAAPWFSGSYSVNEKRKDLFGEPNFGFTNALNFQFGNWFRLRTRLSYNRVSYHSTYMNGIYIGYDGLTGAAYTSGNYRYLFRQFTVGLDVCFVFSGDRMKLNTGFGLDYGQYIRSYFVNGKKADQLTYAANPDEAFVNRGFTSFVGIEIPVKKITLFSELRYTMTNPTNIQDKYWNYLYSINLSAGVRFKSFGFKKKNSQSKVKTKNSALILSVEPRANYSLVRNHKNATYEFTNHYGLLSSVGFESQKGLIVSTGISYSILNSLYEHHSYYTANFYNEMGILGVHFATSFDLLNHNENHFFGPLLRVDGAVLVSKRNFFWISGDISGLYPPEKCYPLC
jgi:hypothetical protein